MTGTGVRVCLRSFTGTGTVNVQYEFLPNNRVNVYWGTCAPTGNAVLVGWTPGNGFSSIDFGSRDLSTDVAAGFTVGTPEYRAINQTATAPVAGSTR